jgi:hypothetical protein
MFWSRSTQEQGQRALSLDPGGTVSLVAGVYTELNGRSQLVKPQSRLPCSWFSAREQFFAAYKSEYLALTEELRNSYHHVYAELAFFVDDDDMRQFESALDVATKHRIERMQKMGVPEEEAFCRRYLSSTTVKILSREQIWDRLRAEETCPRTHLLVLAETLSFCGALYRSMYDEWAIFANFVAHQNSENP